MKQFCIYIIISLLFACNRNQNIEIKNGDLLFVEASSSDIPGAINRVTQLVDNNTYSHIGIVEIGDKKGEVWVLHASTTNGSERISLDQFVQQEKYAGQSIDVYRLKSEYQGYIPGALVRAHDLMGQPYNYSYVLNDTSLYCSDFIHRIFADENIFRLEPMTFLNPATSETDSVWIKYYNKQRIDVPEGLLGCNPNGLAASEKIEFVGRYTKD